MNKNTAENRGVCLLTVEVEIHIGVRVVVNNTKKRDMPSIPKCSGIPM
jgi:hypothetical protein